jgi:hemerythrin superfamily protein
MAAMSDIEIPRPTSGDVVDLILADHRLFEDLLRECRRPEADRAAARAALAEVLVAHATAEEEKVYPTLRRSRAIGEHEEEHGEEEHAEITEALLGFLRAKGTDTDKYDEALEDLATVVNHHSNEEEQTILTPAREDVGQERREELGVAWATRRNQLLEAGCASESQVAELLAQDVAEGTIAPEDVREEAEAIKAEAKEKAEALEEAAKEEAAG